MRVGKATTHLSGLVAKQPIILPILAARPTPATALFEVSIGFLENSREFIVIVLNVLTKGSCS